MEGHETKPHKVEVTRRGFLLGTGSAVVLATEGMKLHSEHDELADSVEETKHDYDPDETIEPEVILETIETSDSVYWDRYVESFKESLARDSGIVIDRVEVIGAIQEHLKLPGVKSNRVRENLERLVPAMSFVESRFDASEVSALNAVGILQLMPKAWEELHLEGEKIENVIDQIKVAGRLLEQTYRHITQVADLELSNIKSIFFANNEEAYEDFFVTPMIIDAYHSGMGRMAELLQKFLARFPEELSLRELSPEGKQLTGYDVFYGLVFTALHEVWDEDYSDNSAQYTGKTYAANQVLLDALTAQEEDL